MSDYIAVINEITEEHQNIRSYAKLVGDSIGDQEALSSLQRVRPDWIPGRIEILTEKQNKLTQTISFLGEGLKNHFTKEERALPSLLGKFLMRALILEHREIIEAVKEALVMVANIKLEGLSREDLMTQEMKIQQKVSDLSNLIEEHAGKEEQMLEMVQKVLEEKASR